MFSTIVSIEPEGKEKAETEMVGLVELRPQAETGVPRILSAFGISRCFDIFDIFYFFYFFDIQSEVNK